MAWQEAGLLRLPGAEELSPKGWDEVSHVNDIPLRLKDRALGLSRWRVWVWTLPVIDYIILGYVMSCHIYHSISYHNLQTSIPRDTDIDKNSPHPHTYKLTSFLPSLAHSHHFKMSLHSHEQCNKSPTTVCRLTRLLGCRPFLSLTVLHVESLEN